MRKTTRAANDDADRLAKSPNEFSHLVTTRQERERIQIGEDIFIEIRQARRGRCRLAISAPRDTPILFKTIQGERARRAPPVARQKKVSGASPDS